MAWSAYLIRTVTGQIGARLDPTSISWSVALNSLETLKINLRKVNLPAVDPTYWLTPWWSGVLLMWDDKPIFAGPILGMPQETFDSIDFDCAGIRSVFARRFVDAELSDWSQLATSVIQYHGMSLGTITKRVVQQAQMKVGGRLPIEYPVPEQTIADDADHQRTYEGFNIQNIDADSVMKKLSDVHNGPDILFKPRLINEAQLVWDLWTGTEHNPRISQAQIPVWDTTVEKSSVTDLSIVSTGAYMTNRVYSIGDGTDQGTLITVSEDLTSVNRGGPLLETAIAISKSSDPKVVKAHGDGTLAANNHGIQEITVTVRADGVYPMGSFWPGDLVEIYVNGWLSLTDGVHKCRLLSMQGDLTDNVRLSMQTEE